MGQKRHIQINSSNVFLIRLYLNSASAEQELDLVKSKVVILSLFLPLPTGFILASIINELCFDLEHTYFTMVQEALRRVTIVHFVHIFLIIVAFGYCLFTVTQE